MLEHQSRFHVCVCVGEVSGMFKQENMLVDQLDHLNTSLARLRDLEKAVFFSMAGICTKI